jgi:hypothetical protein
MSRIFGKICQNGYVVRDVRAAMDHWIDVMGVGPWFYFDRVKIENSGDIQIELIQQRNDAPSMYKEFLDSGREGLQHVAYWTKEYQAVYDRVLSLGYKVGHEGQIGGEQGRFAYFDTEFHSGTVIELSDVSGPKGGFFEYVRQASVDWDGGDPIREL